MSASMRLGFVQSLAGRSTHLLDRIYLGGPFDLRGFDRNSIGTKADTASLGGSFGCAAALHLYRPLVPQDMVKLFQIINYIFSYFCMRFYRRDQFVRFDHVIG